MRLPGKETKQCYSLPICHRMRHGVRQTNKPVLALTYYLSWDETWWMRLLGKEIEQCHSLAICHRMRHGMRQSNVTDLLLVMGWDMIDETSWHKYKVVSLTACWSWNDTLWDSSSCEWFVLSPSPTVDQGMRNDGVSASGTEKMLCYSLSVYE